MTVTHSILEFLILVLCALDAALMGRLYRSHRTGRMSALAAIGFVTVMVGIGVNHAILATRADEATWFTLAGSPVLLIGLLVTLVSLLGVMEIHLFRHDGWERWPGRSERQATEVDRIGKVVDAIDEAVNTRVEGSPSIGDDVASIEARGIRDDERREDGT